MRGILAHCMPSNRSRALCTTVIDDVFAHMKPESLLLTRTTSVMAKTCGKELGVVPDLEQICVNGSVLELAASQYLCENGIPEANDGGLSRSRESLLLTHSQEMIACDGISRLRSFSV